MTDCGLCTLFEITVPQEAAGQRVDVFIAEHSALTRSAVQKLLENGDIRCGGKAKNHRVAAGEVISVRLPPPAPDETQAEDIPLNIVYEDSDIIVINKPRALVVHPAAGHFSGTLVNALLHHCKGSLSGIGGVMRPGIVHRLDKDTSGLLVAAKNDAAHQVLSAQLAARTMGRLYLGICLGAIKKEAFTVDAPIGRHKIHRQKMAVYKIGAGENVPAGVRNAVTHLKVLERLPASKPRFTFFEARLETGRTHQIRVHMAHVGHPLLGDALYGPTKQPFDTKGQILHAARLELVHPSTGEVMVFDAALPGYFSDALERIG